MALLKKKSFHFPGMVATLVMICFLGIGIRFLLHNISTPENAGPSGMKNNEITAYANLNRIARAQKAYLEMSRERFGRRTYSIFLTHLWTAVDPQGQPVKLDLIPEHLAVAVGATKALDGYYYTDIRSRYDAGTQKTEPVDYHSSCAVAAIPRLAGQTGRLVFMADQSGRIWALPVKQYASRHPLDPEAAGWTALPSVTELKTWLAEIFP